MSEIDQISIRREGHRVSHRGRPSWICLHAVFEVPSEKITRDESSYKSEDVGEVVSFDRCPSNR